MAAIAQFSGKMAKRWHQFLLRRARCAPSNSHELGLWGETQAERHLRGKGAKLLRRNFRAPGGGEADLVMRDGKILVFVEVKTRRSVKHGRPGAAVNWDKRRLLERAAQAWLRMLGTSSVEVPWRIDVVEIVVNSSNQVDELRWNKAD